VADDLTARALVLECGESRIALVVCDLILVTGAIVAEARTLIADRYDIPGDHVLIAATHTHTGPPPLSLFGTEVDETYIRWLPGRIADSVGVALSRLTPARAAWGSTEIEGVCFNRRFRMRDETVVFNPPLRSPDIVEPVGPVDPTLTALLIEDLERTPIALWTNFALHYVGTDDPNAISADYFGEVARAIERTLGPGVVGMLTNGASGDVNNRAVQASPGTPAGTRQARRVALAVAAAAIKATAMQRRHESLQLSAETIRFTVSRRSITDEDMALATRLLTSGSDAEDLSDDRSFSFVVGQPIPQWQHEVYAREVLSVAAMPESGETEIQILRIGDLALVAIPGEMFVSLGMDIRTGSPLPETAIVGLANDYVGYLPSQAAFSQGAYETWAARSAWPAPGTGEAMVETVLSRLPSVADPRKQEALTR
jgi:neutral ceramidase